jgi:hypothetical protein
MTKIYRPELKSSSKWLITHTKKTIKNSNDESLYDDFFYGIDNKDKQGDILELYTDCYNNDILHRIDLEGHYNYQPATKDQDIKQHHDFRTSNALGQCKNTRHLLLGYVENGKYIRSNVNDFFAEFMKRENREKQAILVTTARRESIDPRIFEFDAHVVCRDDLYPYLSKTRLVDFIKYIELGVEYFQEQKKKIIASVRKDIPYDYQQKAFDEHKRKIDAGEKLDQFERIGQGGGKTDIIKNQGKCQLKQGIHTVIAFPQLRLMEDMMFKIVPDVLGTKGLTHTSIYGASSRKEWLIQKDGFDVESFSVSSLLNNSEKRDLMYKSGQATLTLLCYDQLENFNKMVQLLKAEDPNIKFGLSCDETASQAPRVEIIGKQKEKKHWKQILIARTLFDHIVFYDANYTEQCKKDLNNIFTDVGQEELIRRGITKPIDLVVVSNTTLPRELQQLKGLKNQQKCDLGVLCKIIQDESKDHVDNFRDKTLGYTTWSDARSCKDVEKYLQNWIEEQDFGCDVNIGSITSHQTSSEQQDAMKLEHESGLTLWLSKYMLARGIDKRTMSFGAGFDTRHEEELSHTLTRINRRHPLDGLTEKEAIHKPRARWYVGQNGSTDHVRDILAKMQSVGLDCGNVIIEERPGHIITIPIKKYTKPDHEVIKKLKGTKIQSVFKARKDDLEEYKKQLLLLDASKRKTADEITDFIFKQDVQKKAV